MGKVYAHELAALGDTLNWARTVAVGPLQTFVAEAHDRPLLAVGSGGSATAAHLAALLHRFRNRAFARHATPLDVLLSEPNLDRAAVLLLSASGKNRDMLTVMRACTNRDVPLLATICTQRESLLAAEARANTRAWVFEENAPSGKDGFLATNSLFATCVILARAFGTELPNRLYETPSPIAAHLSGRQSIQVLYGGWGAPAATDLESKFNESSIAAAQVSDYRNFGHGRHLWLARRAPETLVVALVTPETATLAKRTLAVIPPDVPVVELATSHDEAAGAIDLIVQGFYLIGSLGYHQSFDPGRPSVPDFGRRLFRLTPGKPSAVPAAPVMRKLSSAPARSDDLAAQLGNALAEFEQRLAAAKFAALVFDYDGTLCTREERFKDLRGEVTDELRRLLDGGLVIGVATGRGRSVRASLQKSLPRELWDRVVVGYYNGGQIATLDDYEAPDRTATPVPPLDAAYEALRLDPILGRLAALTPRACQVTVEPTAEVSTDTLLSHVMTVIASLEHLMIRVVASSHSVDVLAPGVSKLDVVGEVQRRMPAEKELLCIGDRGRWPGNDAALLSHVPSLSVDEVSSSPTTCWNLAPPGVSGPAAAVRYLRALRLSSGYATFTERHMWRAR